MRRSITPAAALFAALALAGGAYAAEPDYEAEGGASWYGEPFHGRKTASGERFDMHQPTAAHRTLPLGSWVEVTNLANDRSVQVRINDRGPFKASRIIDVSRAAADELGFRSKGVARVRVKYIGRTPGELRPMILAEAAASSLEAADPLELTGDAAVEAPDSAAAPAPPAPVLVAQSGFAVQVGTFAKRDNADRAAAAVAAFGPVIIKPLALRGLTLHRVIVGAFPGEAEAEAALPDLARAGFTDVQVVSVP